MMLRKRVLVLDEFILQNQKDFAYASGELSSLLRDLGVAAKIVHREVNKAGLVDILGQAGSSNIQGEDQQKLDVFANDEFVNALSMGGHCAGIASEENDDIVNMMHDYCLNGSYVVTMDPLDGSSNIDVNISVGTIFSIYKRLSESGSCTRADFLQKGVEQVAAGYIVYGSSTMLIYTTGNGVNGFTLDPSIGEFCLSHPNIKMPKDGSTYSINQGNFLQFEKGVQDYIRYCQGIDESNPKPYSLRYVGSMVADIHRSLLKGGIFMYPVTTSAPNGKLRLLYECNPMAMIVEQAGGKATDGKGNRILEIEPIALHQRVPAYLGSENMIDKVESFLKQQ